tara:strand:+ start:55 stop:1164 length:1110 start_codon:yes stop_codon:yes gene_type:complete
MTKKILIICFSLLITNNLFSASSLPPCEGEDSLKYTNCFGKIENYEIDQEDGSKYLLNYEGEFREGLAHGQGKMHTHSYSKDPNYFTNEEGTFKEGYLHGDGTFVSGVKDEWFDEYKGKFKDGAWHGYGELKQGFDKDKGIWAETYAGNWKNDNLKKGIKTSKGDFGEAKYEGGFNENLEHHGKGTYTSTNSGNPFTFKGQFKDNYPSGKGKFVWTKNNKSYEGNFFSNDELFSEGKFYNITKGTITLADGQKYIGDIKDWKPHGNGKYLDRKGEEQRYFDDNKELEIQAREREMEENQRKAENQRIQEMYVEAKKLRVRVAKCYVKYSLNHFREWLDAIDNYHKLGYYDRAISLSKNFLTHPQVPGDC